MSKSARGSNKVQGVVLVDSHAHLDSPRYDADRDELLERAWQQGVRTVLSIGIGDGPDTMQQALELSRSYAGKPGIPRILATAGIHPHEAQLADQAALEKLDVCWPSPEVLAVGEIGLDYYYDHSPREQQKQAFAQQMEIAAARQAADHHPLPAFRGQHQCMGRHSDDDRDQLGGTESGRHPALFYRRMGACQAGHGLRISDLLCRQCHLSPGGKHSARWQQKCRSTGC